MSAVNTSSSTCQGPGGEYKTINVIQVGVSYQVTPETLFEPT